ncbi:PREDICTED: uncharacterized protein LOC104788682 isoform X2 [Camelina sativa]|uniref:Uncharacterized protein LOC104788682 isoform X2 n=1 Tax=Camelina sativa TaxID=90675 RepID=A0ABM0ZAJ3_CAMSA|nr:PREDICTED: uncharacterized protein LOC104788682 isoform X2 [Camelina sativa]
MDNNNNKSIGVNEQVLEKQIGGCMAGFFNIFDRPHLLSPKRLSSSSSSSSPPSPESYSASERSSPLLKSRYIGKNQKSVYSTPDLLLSPSPDSHHLLTRSPPLSAPDERSPSSSSSSSSSRSSSSPWRFSKEAPRLSLDSRAVLDAKGSLKPRPIPPDSSPSVIARLMGLEPLPPQLPLQRSASESRLSRDYTFFDFHDVVKAPEDPARPTPPPPSSAVRRKPFFDSGDFFPPDRVSKISGFQAPPNDLETLKQLLQALRLKGLLHSSSSNKHHHTRIHNHINDVSARSPSGFRSRPVTPSLKSPPKSNRTARPTLKEQRRVSPFPWQRPQPLLTERSKSSSRRTISSQEMWKVDDYNRQGKTLLERCDKLLHSIAEMGAAEAAEDSQPSPVSVLDASLYHEDSSPSPVMKRSLDFESEDESWGGSFSFSSSLDSEYVYISDILRASHCLPQESDIFSLLEKQQYLKGKCASRAAAQERRLIFDAVQEIVGRRSRLPPWMMVAEADKMQVIWSEYQKIRKTKSSTEAEEDDLVGYVCGVLGRDLSEDRWRDRQVDMSEAVLDIERLVFKDLIGETIRHLAFLNRSDSLRRRLLF